MITYDVEEEELEPDPTDKFTIKEDPLNFPKGYLRSLTPSRYRKTTRGHVILNHGQVTWTTPELAPPSPNYHTNGRTFQLWTDLTCIAALHVEDLSRQAFVLEEPIVVGTKAKSARPVFLPIRNCRGRYRGPPSGDEDIGDRKPVIGCQAAKRPEIGTCFPAKGCGAARDGTVGSSPRIAYYQTPFWAGHYDIH
ncbi:hypothetical protein TNCV_2564531 [Trichonephila clavipes]|nr:hypothetical protein TNCV_2564531 [Trichonephila clavipes]